MTPCPFSLLVLRSSVLDREILFVRDRKLTVPPELAHLPKFSWRELLALLESGVTSADLPQLVNIREEFGGFFIPKDAPPQKLPPRPRAIPTPPVVPKPTTKELF